MLHLESSFQPGHGALCDGANQIVVRNSQSPLSVAVRREGSVSGGEGMPAGVLSHDDMLK